MEEAAINPMVKLGKIATDTGNYILINWFN
jgi:hypothetical protein